MDTSDAIREKLGSEWIPAIYKTSVRSQRTRSYNLEVPPRENMAEIQYTLLGIELKVGKRRLACPDLATARYLRVFARLGSQECAIPYDITRISSIADELETAWQKTLLLIDADAGSSSRQARGRRRAAVIRSLRDEIAEIGDGAQMPEFDRQTRGRR